MNPEQYLHFESDPYWPNRFETEQAKIRTAAPDGLLGVVHVGSTAIRDVPGKPALDIIAIYETDDAIEAAASELCQNLDYEHAGDSAVLIREAADHVTIIKLHTPTDEKARNQILFRDYLRDNPSARADYIQVKQEALEAHPDDYEAYTMAKSDMVFSILDQARDDGYEHQLPDFVS